MYDLHDLHVQTGSVPTAAFLACAGYAPIRVTKASGTRGPMFVFSPAARDSLNQFLRTKQMLDAMLEEADGAR